MNDHELYMRRAIELAAESGSTCVTPPLSCGRGGILLGCSPFFVCPFRDSFCEIL